MDEVKVEEFFSSYMQEITTSAATQEDFTEEVFVEEMCNFLEDTAYINNYQMTFFKKTSKGLRIDAWDYNDKRGLLTLIISDFSPELNLRTINQSSIAESFKKLERFIYNVINTEYFDSIDHSNPVYSVAKDIYNLYSKVNKVNLILITNAIVSDRVKVEKFEADNIGRETVFNVWDIKRRALLEYSGKEKEDVVIDFTEFIEGGLDYLQAYDGYEKCKSYLLAFPGHLLAEVYGKYGDRLLEQNVRTFLQFRGKVNKGIKNTLKNEPDLFFAYNNGLTVTAESVQVQDGKMLNVKNMQIVNGGQTTASLFMTNLKEKQVDLSKVYVQVKMSVIEAESVDTIVPLISKYANTQNKVSSSDFFSNHPFHKRIEDLSRRTLAPARGNALNETYWFYERARGQYANKQAQMTNSQKKQFLLKNPKDQKFTKTDLAKFENIFRKLPHFVSKGAQWNFAKFAQYISGDGNGKSGIWDTKESSFNELYFKHLVAKCIIFKSLDKQIMRQRWYNGYKANIVSYTLAKFVDIIDNKNHYIDYSQIWSSQSISSDLETELIALAEIINSTITDTAENVTQYCKKIQCWDRIQKKYYNFESNSIIEISEYDPDEYIEKKEIKKQKLYNDIEAQVELYNRPKKYWLKAIQWSSKQNILTEKEMQILSTTNSNRPPSPKQCIKILEIEQKLIEEGFSYNG